MNPEEAARLRKELNEPQGGRKPEPDIEVTEANEDKQRHEADAQRSSPEPKEMDVREDGKDLGEAPHEPSGRPRKKKTHLILLVGVMAMTVGMATIVKQRDTENAVSAEARQETPNPAPAFTENDRRLDSLENAILQLREMQRDTLTRIADLESEIEAARSSQENQNNILAALSQRVESLEIVVKENAEQIKSVKREKDENRRVVSRLAAIKAARTTPGFHLVSVDLWAGRPQAVIEASGRMAFFEEGDAIGKWRITSLDLPSASMTLVGPGGRTIRMVAGGRK